MQSIVFILSILAFLSTSCGSKSGDGKSLTQTTPRPETPPKTVRSLNWDLSSVDLDGENGDEFRINDSWTVKIISGAKDRFTELSFEKEGEIIQAFAKRSTSLLRGTSQSILHEIERTKLVQGPGAIELYGTTNDKNGNPVLILEKMTKEYGKMDYAFKDFLSLVKSLERFHKLGVVHQDIKPQNVMVDQEGELKFIDFTGTDWGTSFYSDRETGSVEGDMYALAMTVLERKHQKSLKMPQHACHRAPHVIVSSLLRKEIIDYSKEQARIPYHYCYYLEEKVKSLIKELESYTRAEIFDKLKLSYIELGYDLNYAPREDERLKYLTSELVQNLIEIESKQKNLVDESAFSLIDDLDPVDAILKKMMTFSYKSISQVREDLEALNIQ